MGGGWGLTAEEAWGLRRLREKGREGWDGIGEKGMVAGEMEFVGSCRQWLLVHVRLDRKLG